MKKLTLTTMFAMLTIAVLTQAPQGISHQAVIRDASNQLVTESPIGIQVSIIQGTPEGTVVYSETHTPTSNANGLITFVIGQGTVVSGVFDEIDGSAGPYFIKTEADPAGGTNYTITGTSQVWSVPYALFSQKSATLKDGSIPGEILYWNGLEWLAIPPGEHDQTLRLCNGAPTWGACRYNLDLLTNPAEAGTLTGAGQYQAGEQVNISAAANPGWYFLNWTDDDGIVSEVESFTYTMPAQFVTLTANFSEEQVGFTCGDPITDIDGNSYNTIAIGVQCWMKENLKTTKYRNNTPIEYPGADHIAWQNNTTGAYAWYSNDISWKDSYGALYNWYAINNANGLCPTGWYVPSDAELNVLILHIDPNAIPDASGSQSVIAGGKMKSTRTTPAPHPRWESPNTGATNESNWSGLPGGYCNADGTFSLIDSIGGWWSSTEYTAAFARVRYLYYSDSKVHRHYTYKSNGFSLRCLKDETTPPSIYNLNLNVDPSGAGTVTGAGFYEAGEQVNITAVANPGWVFVNWTDEDSEEVSTVANFLYTMPAENIILNANFQELSGGDGQPCPGMPTVNDIDGNIYNTVLIGVQCWMKENLKTTKYRNGTSIENPTGNSDWQNNTTGAYAWYNNDIGWKDSYGALYNWHAVNNANGLCPTGWHVPTDAEFTAMTNHLGGTSVAGGKMKSTRTAPDPHPRWAGPNTGATNESNWSGLPGGRRISNGAFGSVGSYGHWWSATEYLASYGLNRYLDYFVGDVFRVNFIKPYGFSVRCLRD